MDIKELWNEGAISSSFIKKEPSFKVEDHKSIDIFIAFEKRINTISRISIPLSVLILCVYLYIGFYELAIILMLIVLFSAYMSFKFLKRIKKNRFVLNLKNYLKETSNVLTNYIRFNLYGILFTALVLVPTLYIIGINSYFNSMNLLSLSLFKEHSGLFVGFGTGILLYVFMSLFVLHKVYYRALKEVNKAIKNLDAE
jgi:hypothetical protein